MHLRALALATLSTALLLTGCAEDEPKPIVKPTETVATTPTETSTPEKETPEEFIRRWNDLLSDMQQGQTDAYRTLVPDCRPCMETADQIDEIYASGGYVKTDGRTIKRITKSPNFASGTSIYRLIVDAAPTELRRSADAPMEKITGGRAVFDVLLAEVEGRWSLQDYWRVTA